MVKTLVAINKSKSPNGLIVSFNKLPPSLNNAITVKISKYMTPFILILKICNMNVHNCLVDSDASSNVMPHVV